MLITSVTARIFNVNMNALSYIRGMEFHAVAFSRSIQGQLKLVVDDAAVFIQCFPMCARLKKDLVI